MEHPPGAEGQIDFFKSKARVRDPRSGGWKYPWVFRMTLSCSKHGYEEGLADQKAVSFMRAQEHAFLELGVPRVVRLDNAKTAVARGPASTTPTSTSSTRPSPSTGASSPCPHDLTTLRSRASRSAAGAMSTTTRSRAAASRAWPR
jgi:hypothetical protein